MVKKSSALLFTIGIILLSKIASAQFLPFYENKKSTNAVSMMKFNGKVKSVKQTVFIAKDSLGKIIKGARKFENGISINNDFFMLFDVKGRAIKETFYSSYANHNYLIEIDHRYDSIKNIEMIAQSEDGKINSIYTYKYSNDGKMLQEDISYIFKDKTSNNQKFTFKYDVKGNLSESNYYNNGQKFEKKILYKSDDKGNLFITEYNEKGILLGKETIKTDLNGNISEHAYYIVDTNTVEHSFNYKYDKNNNVIQKGYFKPGVKSKKYTYTYEYDKTGNWIKKIDFEDDKAVLITERKFEYY